MPLVAVVAVAIVAAVSLIVAAAALFPPRCVLAALSRRSGVRFFFPPFQCRTRTGAAPRKLISLTIDDAPSAGAGLILVALRQHSVRATFFVIGSSGAAHSALLQQIAAEGHELANHDFVDRHSAAVPLAQLMADVARTEEVIQSASASGVRARWFRPGGGRFTSALVAAVDAMGYETVLADVYSHDVRLHSVSAIYHHMRLSASSGGIMLLHDGSIARAEQAAQVLQRLLPELKRQGFTFLTLSEHRQEVQQDAME